MVVAGLHHLLTFVILCLSPRPSSHVSFPPAHLFRHFCSPLDLHVLSLPFGLIGLQATPRNIYVVYFYSPTIDGLKRGE
jgi:hypothetical protein